MKTYVLRLHPGQDLRLELVKFAQENDIQAGFIISCVGSLKRAALRMAGQFGPVASFFEEKFEILSLVGTISPDKPHLHIALSNADAKMVGGHLQGGSLVDLTAEIIIGDLEDKVFRRELDTQTGFPELVVYPRRE